MVRANKIAFFLTRLSLQGAYTSLMLASRRGHVAVVQALLEAGAALDIKCDVSGYVYVCVSTEG